MGPLEKPPSEKHIDKLTKIRITAKGDLFLEERCIFSDREGHKNVKIYFCLS
jgi:hypothetical protein